MTDRTDAGDDERRFDARSAPRFHPPFAPPFAGPFGPFPPPFAAPFGPFAPPFVPPFAPPFAPPFGPYPPPFPSAGPPPFYPPGPPAADAGWHRAFLEAQRTYFTWYREQLDRWSAEQSGEPLREALNALLASWLEALSAFREQREQALRAQSELVSRYLDVLDDLLEKADGPQP